MRRIDAVPVAIFRLLRSNWFFVATIALFCMSAGWIALANSFPLVFDENYHFGVIDIYSRQHSPFITEQPDEAKYYGDITRDPSYLYHYLMSYPYRLVSLFTDNTVAHIVTLRVINIALVAASLIFWRRVITRLGLGRAGAHIVLFFFTIIPLVPYLAAHINYDNLVLLLLPLLFLQILNLRTSSHSGIWLLLAAGTAGVLSVVKFSMLPVVATVAIAALVILWRRYQKAVVPQLIKSLQAVKRRYVILAALFALLGVGLCLERYAVNYVSYGNHTPDCIDIHSYESCAENSVWIRNYNASQSAQNLDRSQLWSPYEYSVKRWFPHIFSDLFVVASFADASTEIHRFMPQQLMASKGSSLARIVSAVTFVAGLLMVLVMWRRFPSRTALYLLMGSFIVYAASLWIINYSSYMELGRIYATQGRYMIPFIIPVVATIVLAVSLFLRRWGKNGTRVGLLLVVIFLLGFVQAAGALSYIVYSGENWQWDLGSFREWTTTLRDILSPLLRR